MNHLVSPSTMPSLQRVAKVAAAFVVSIGCLVLIGWILDMDILKSVLPGLVTMKANTALGFVLSGTSLFLLIEPSSKQRLAGRLCSLFVIAICLATLVEYVLGWNLGIDQLLATDDPQPINTLSPGRMSPLTAVCFTWIGIALWLSGAKTRQVTTALIRWVEVLSVLTSLSAVQVLIAYLYQVQAILGFIVYTHMAVHTALCFVVLSVGILLAHPHHGLVRVMTADSAGGVIARRLLPAAIAIPLILGWLRITSERMGLVQPAFGMSILIVLYISIFAGLILWNAQQLHRIDLQRQSAVKALQQANDELEARIGQRTTELRETDNRLTQSEERLSLAIEGAGMATWDLDLQTDKLLWSAQHFKLMGYEPVASGEATIEMWRSRVHSDDLTRVMQAMERAQREQTLFCPEHRIIRADNGQVVWLRVFGRFFYNEVGQAVRFIGILFDNTEKKQAQEERDRFFTLSLDMLCIAGVDGYFKQLNPAWERILGYTQAELMAQPFVSFVHPEDRARTSVEAERHARRTPAVNFENRYRCKDGSYKWLSWASVASSENGLLYSVARDVTARKQAEQQLEQQATTLQRQADLLELTYEAIIVRDEQGAITYWNRGAEEMYGWMREEAIGHVTHSFLHTQFPQPGVDFDKILLQQERWQGELTHACKEGQQIIVESRQVLIRNEQGIPTGFLEVNRDITERKQAEVDLQKYKDIFQFAEHGLAISRGTMFDRVNPAFAHMHGYTVEELLGKPILDLYPSECHTETIAFIQQLNEAGHLTYESSHVRKDGTVFPVFIDVTIVTDEQGNALYRIVNIFDITERKQAEAALRQTEERFRRAILDAPLAIMLHAEDGEVVQVNHAWTDITGYRPEELRTIAEWTEKAYGSQSSLVQADVKRLYTLEHRVFEGEYALRTRTGEKRLWDFYSAPLGKLPDGRCLVITTAIDVTEQRLLEQEQHRLASIVENSPDFIGTANLDGQLIYLNLAGRSMVGLEPTAPVNHLRGRDFHPPEYEDDMQHNILHTMIEQGFWEGESLMRHFQTGELIPVHQIAFVNRDRQTGQPLSIATVARDIRERKRAEEAILDLNRELQRQLTESQTLLEVIPIGIGIATDPECKNIRVNPAFARQLGIPSTENASLSAPNQEKPSSFKVYTDGRELSPEELPMQYAVAHGVEVLDLEVDVVRDDGKVVTLLEYAAPLFDEAGKSRGCVAAFLDISDRKQAEAEVRQLNATLEQRVEERTAQLQEANKELEAFSYTVAHDLRAPLRGIQGFAQALVEDYGDRLDETAQEYIQYIFEGTDRMNELVQDLLAYSRLSREQIRLTSVRLTQVVAEAQVQLQSELRDRQAEITVTEPLPNVMGHRPILVQMVVNLLSNGMKFVAPGVQPQIRVWTQEQDNWVRLWIEDNGIGIEPQYQEQIFGVFERLHGREAYPGTGIGLAIVRKGAERLGGQTGVESTPGRGSRFWVELQGVR
ncbi:PAS domain S-box protein [Microcoleus sp. ZQ-A2]|nr:PAS domain S-box protein [Microcoleus sp. FACHB-1]